MIDAKPIPVDPATQVATDLIAQFEGCKLEVYLDLAGIPTIGFGSTYYANGAKVAVGDPPITLAEAKNLLSMKVDDFIRIIDACVDVPMNPNEVAALASFVYNVGPGAFKKSTLLELLNRGEFSSAADQLLLWNKAEGRVVPGLESRRMAERDLFNTPYQSMGGLLTGLLATKGQTIQK